MPARRAHQMLVLVSVPLLVGLLASVARGQGRTITLYGKVTDASGAVLPGVTVTVSSPQLIKGQESATTDDGGRWRVANLMPGTYSVKAELPGFATAVRPGLVAEAGVQLSSDFVLSVSTVQETVTVAGEAPVVDVRSARQVHTVDTKLIEDVPLPGRTYADVVNALPGITDGGKYTYSLTQTVHGSGVRDNDYIIDGQSSKHPSGYSGTEFSIEAIEEVQVTTGGVSAEFGQASGGIFTFVTKSGGDRSAERCTAIWWMRPSKVTTSRTISSDQGVDPNAGIESDINWGANLGGPIKKQKLWFFVDFNRSDQQGERRGVSARAGRGLEAAVFRERHLAGRREQSPAGVVQSPAPLDAALQSRCRLPARPARVAKAVLAAQAFQRAVDVGTRQ